MARYDIPEEHIFIIGGRNRRGELVLEDKLEGDVYVANPGRRVKRDQIELPMGQFEDLRVRVGLVRSTSHGKYPDVQITRSQDIYALMSPMSNEPQEVISVILMNTKNIVIGICEVSRGGTSSTLVEPQTVFQPAILSNATGIIIVHNHPSGNTQHSPDDLALSRHIQESANMLGIRMLDFIIIGDKDYTSFADEGLV
jgi:DNA repair protein RadC